MAKLKLLYICHNHPTVRPGGAEAYALELYEAMRASDQFEPIFLARTGPPVSNVARYHEGTLFTTIGRDSNQYFMYTDASDFDWFYGTPRDKDVFVKFFHKFLLAQQPDIVHFQHTLFLGYDIIRQVKNTLPDVPLVYTLHEYLSICHRQGQMVRTTDQQPCRESSPRRCHECFPDISPQSFFMRNHFIQSHLSLIDIFLAPSQFLLERHVDWGIPREKIRFEEYGRLPVTPIAESGSERLRNQLGFFGQFSFYKGVNVLLKAMKILDEDNRKTRPMTLTNGSGIPVLVSTVTDDSSTKESDLHLRVHGANLELQPESFRNEFNVLIEATDQNVTLVGRYEHDELPKLMASIDWVIVPSIWWENSPLVIQEAFAHGRPVICSDIGGMAEKVTHGVNGLHFRAGDPASLAKTIRYAVSTPGLWEKLRSGIPEAYKMEQHVVALTDIYTALLEHTVVQRVPI